MQNTNMEETSKLYSILSTNEALIVRRFHIQLEAVFSDVPDTQSNIKELVILQLIVKAAQLYRRDGVKVADLTNFNNLSPVATRLSALKGLQSAIVSDSLPEFNPKLVTFFATHIESVALATYLMMVYSYQVNLK